jgi:hypothetical protein
MAEPTQADALQKALRGLEFGDLDTKIDAIVEIVRIDEKEIANLSRRIRDILQRAPDAGEQLIGAAKLAKHGIKCDPIVPILVHALKEFSTEPPGRTARFMAIEAMSHIKGDPRIIEALKQLYQYGSGWAEEKDFAIWALGAIGDPETKPLIGYAAEQGNRDAKAALKLFGTGTFRQIQEEATGFSPTTQEKSGCFVATVVFEDAHAPEVIFLRSFRDHHLLTNWFGRLLVIFYQHVGPPLSKIVSRFPVLKAIVRTGFRSLLHILHPNAG